MSEPSDLSSCVDERCSASLSSNTASYKQTDDDDFPIAKRRLDDDLSPPPARKSEEERDALFAAQQEAFHSKQERKRRQPVALAYPGRPRCFTYGPLPHDPVCGECQWVAVCSPLPQVDKAEARTKRREGQRHFCRFFYHAHMAIYGYKAPNLHADDALATLIQVRCLRDGVDPRLFLLHHLVSAYDVNPHERFDLAWLSGVWENFLETRQFIVHKYGRLDARAICDSCAFIHLYEHIAPLLESEPFHTDAEVGAALGCEGTSKAHLFSRAVADALNGDVEAAILYEHFRWWCDKARKQESERHYHQKRYWRYDSLDQLAERFPYLSRSTIDRRLLKLEERGYLRFGNFNHWKTDKTRWYHACTKDGEGEEIKAGGNISFRVEDALRWESVVHACVLATIRRRIRQNLKEGRRPVALLSGSQLTDLLPFAPRTIRRAIKDLLGDGPLGLCELDPPEGFAENEGIKVPQDGRIQPKLYYFASSALDEYFTPGKNF